MATRKVNEAVEIYREMELLDQKRMFLEDKLSGIVNGLSGNETSDYYDMTREIELAVADAVLSADARRLTTQGTLREVKEAANRAGKDKSRV